MDNFSKIEIIELFMAKCGKNGWDRCFHGTIKRGFDESGSPVVRGKIKVNNGFIYAMAKDQWELGERLDEIVLMILDYSLHSLPVVTTTICVQKTKACNTCFFLN